MRLLDLLLPARCPICGQLGSAPCPPCESALPPPPSLPPPPGIDRCVAVTAYRDSGRAVVTALKFAGARGSLPWAAARLGERLGTGHRCDAVTWVPTTPAHRRRRGVDQAEELARALARELGLPARPLLRRLPGPPQAGRRAGERRAGPPLAPARAGTRRRPGPRSVIVVDDVVTTGGSLAAAARVLRSAGVSTVVGACVARTPSHRHRP